MNQLESYDQYYPESRGGRNLLVRTSKHGVVNTPPLEIDGMEIRPRRKVDVVDWRVKNELGLLIWY